VDMGAAPGLAAKRWRTGARVLDTASVSRGPGGVSWAGLGKAVSVSIVGGLGEGEEGLGRGRGAECCGGCGRCQQIVSFRSLHDYCAHTRGNISQTR
jgi:hypothetical protein